MDVFGDDEAPSCIPEPDPQFYDFLGLSHSTDTGKSQPTDSKAEKSQIQRTDLSDFLGLSHSTDSREEKFQIQWDSTDAGLKHSTDSGLTHSTDSKTEKFQIQWDSSVPDLVVSWFSRQNYPKPTPQEVVDTITSFYSLWKRRHFTYSELHRLCYGYNGTLHLDTFSTLGEEFQILLKGVSSEYFKFGYIAENSNGSRAAVYLTMHVNIKDGARISFINGHFRAITNLTRTQSSPWTSNQVEYNTGWELCSLVDTSGFDLCELRKLGGLQLDYYCNIGQIEYCDGKHPNVQLFPSLTEKCTFQWKIEGDDMKMLKDGRTEDVCIVNRSLCDLGWTLALKLRWKSNGCYGRKRNECYGKLCVEPLYPPTLEGSYIGTVSVRVWYEIGGVKIEKKINWRAEYRRKLLVSENNFWLEFKDLVDESEFLLEGDISADTGFRR